MPRLPPLRSPLLALLTALCAASGTAQPGQPPLTIEYRDKPPYSYTEGGKPAGFLMERTARLLKRAGIEAHYAEVPIRRTLLNLQANQAPLCSPGLYKIPEREAFARFSLPIHRDRPHVVPTLQPGLLDGVSYGQQLDQALAATAKPAIRAQLTPLQLARMVGARRVDYMLIDEEDLAWLRKDPDFVPLQLVRIEFADMPRGQLRYFGCSQQVTPQTMDKLNQAIREQLPEMQAE
ncbi:MAG: transporter substrate-binding domain-containing protein [Burkholderiales bacterium]|nr:transporter substrate-binding domain-containing protein [Burkholderiales bacterium]